MTCTTRRPTSVVRDHLAWLAAAGMTRQAVTADSGVSDRTLRNVIHGTRPSVNGDTAALLLAVRPRAVVENGRLPALGTVRRLQALVAYGYGIEHISTLSGLSMRHLFDLVAGRRPTVTIRVRHMVTDVYERYSTTPGPSKWAWAAGRARGWALPGAWDNIDDPDAVPQRGYTSRPDRLPGVLVGRVLRGEASIHTLTDDERAELWQRWAAERAAEGIAPTVSAFTRTFGLRYATAARIRTAALSGTETNPYERKVV
ncbi:hypothetical protein O7626_39865 [Micromonospora sp. WMMD1102]|uniref:hypothetical protein n=1 Tax=Micromonospora sp. WMMD1102 TaxID=3016105 RepID=UPI002414F955|nr:hypothetical protein [Micromonospora sp. WMMD1102]MDG4791973.1 hypothetical protein [Micromonospora sp. WMMD1102]